MSSVELNKEYEVDITAVAHGGHCIGRVNGQVVFVRHTAPGERVRIRITSLTKGGKIAFADAIEVLTASEHRITPPCAAAGACGGCDFMHLDLGYQRELKTNVLREQLVRLAGLAPDSDLVTGTVVEALTSSETGLGWRSRMEYSTTSQGRIGMRRHGSHDVVPISQCRIAHPLIATDGVTNVPWAAGTEIRAVATSEGHVAVLPEASTESPRLTEKVGDFVYHVNARGFWQSHKDAPAVFVETALEMLDLKSGQHVLDLYAGAGLFTLPLAAAVGAGGRVDAVEGDPIAMKDLRSNLREYENVNTHLMSVEKWLGQRRIKNCDMVLLDPSRMGAGKAVIAELARLRPDKIVYVACDPAALGRDIALLREAGYSLTRIRSFDAFPMTHHMETFATFER